MIHPFSEEQLSLRKELCSFFRAQAEGLQPGQPVPRICCRALLCLFRLFYPEGRRLPSVFPSYSNPFSSSVFLTKSTSVFVSSARNSRSESVGFTPAFLTAFLIRDCLKWLMSASLYLKSLGLDGSTTLLPGTSSLGSPSLTSMPFSLANQS